MCAISAREGPAAQQRLLPVATLQEALVEPNWPNALSSARWRDAGNVGLLAQHPQQLPGQVTWQFPGTHPLLLRQPLLLSPPLLSHPLTKAPSRDHNYP